MPISSIRGGVDAVGLPAPELPPEIPESAPPQYVDWLSAQKSNPYSGFARSRRRSKNFANSRWLEKTERDDCKFALWFLIKDLFLSIYYFSQQWRVGIFRSRKVNNSRWQKLYETLWSFLVSMQCFVILKKSNFSESSYNFSQSIIAKVSKIIWLIYCKILQLVDLHFHSRKRWFVVI